MVWRAPASVDWSPSRRRGPPWAAETYYKYAKNCGGNFSLSLSLTHGKLFERINNTHWVIDDRFG